MAQTNFAVCNKIGILSKYLCSKSEQDCTSLTCFSGAGGKAKIYSLKKGLWKQGYMHLQLLIQISYQSTSVNQFSNTQISKICRPQVS